MILGLALAAMMAGSAEPVPAEVLCLAGAYRLVDGTYVDVVPSDASALRWRMLDGSSGLLTRRSSGAWTSTLGWTGRPDGIEVRFGACDEGRIEFGRRTGSKIPLDVVDTIFDGAGVRLRGRLLLPRGRSTVPVAVLLHGAEDYSGVERYHRQFLLAAHGIGVLVYDKRGTGRSTGKYSQDFHLLAADAAAAMREARRLAGARARSVGFDGASQAAWIAPLAATKVHADFVAVGYGLAEGPLAEDREQVMSDLRAAGYGPDVLVKARAVTDATGLIVGSGFTRGFDELDAARAKYASEPWWGAIRGEFTGELAAHTGTALRAMGTSGDTGTTWNYDPMPALRALDAPLLWVLAGEDREAPIAETRTRLLALARDGKPVTLVVFPGTDHGILEFESAADGKRTSLRYADGYFRLLVEWLRTGRIANGPYGKAEILAEP